MAFKPYPKSKLDAAIKIYDDPALTYSERISELWFLSNGDKIIIKDLRDSHLQKIIKVFQDNPNWRKQFQPAIYAEIDRRAKNKLIKASKAGKILYADS